MPGHHVGCAWSSRSLRAALATCALLGGTLLLSGTRALAAGAPTIEGESVAGVTEHGARLEAVIDPNGLEATYEFWLTYNVCQHPPLGHAACAAIVSESVGEGHIEAGETAETVSADLAHLTPGYSYEYRVQAANADGKAEGETERFTALSPSLPQSLATIDITSGSATLEGRPAPA